jgi:hypothetical protein
MVLFLVPIAVAGYAFYQTKRKKEKKEDELRHLDQDIVSGVSSEVVGEDRVAQAQKSPTPALTHDQVVTPHHGVPPVPKNYRQSTVIVHVLS